MKIETRMIPEYGVTLDGVWLPYSMLEELAEQEPWDSMVYDAYIRPNAGQEKVLLAHGLAEKETKGGLHRGEKLQEFIGQIEF